MSYYYNLYLSSNVCTEILDTIETAVENAEGFDEIYDLIKLYDHIEDEMDESATKQNKETQRWLEQQQLFEERKVDDIFRFYKIKAVLEDYGIEMNVEKEFHLICDLSEVLNADKNNE